MTIPLTVINRILFAGVLAMGLTGCTKGPDQGSSGATIAAADSFQAGDTLGNPIADPVADTLNYTDPRGLKQGHWQRYYKGRLSVSEEYLDGRLHGKCFYYTYANGEIFSTEYVKGKKQGYSMRYHPDSVFANTCSYYEDDTLAWFAFPWEQYRYIIHYKGFHAKRDTVYIRIPYNSGKLMYEGSIGAQQKKYSGEMGIHKAWYETGELKAVLDFDADSIEVFERNGKRIEKTVIGDWRTRMRVVR